MGLLNQGAVMMALDKEIGGITTKEDLTTEALQEVKGETITTTIELKEKIFKR